MCMCVCVCVPNHVSFVCAFPQRILCRYLCKLRTRSLYGCRTVSRSSIQRNSRPSTSPRTAPARETVPSVKAEVYFKHTRRVFLFLFFFVNFQNARQFRTVTEMISKSSWYITSFLSNPFSCWLISPILHVFFNLKIPKS